MEMNINKLQKDLKMLQTATIILPKITKCLKKSNEKYEVKKDGK